MQVRLIPREGRGAGYTEIYGAIGLLALLVARFVPVARLPFWGCPVRRLTGVPCLGCGMTRAFDRLSHGRFAAALDANPLGACLASFAALFFAYALLSYLLRWPKPWISLSNGEGLVLRFVAAAAILLNYGYVVGRTLHWI